MGRRKSEEQGGLTVKRIESVLSEPRPATGQIRKLADAQGLYLLIPPSGSPAWRMKYRFAGKERTYSVGVWPATGLATARAKRDAARELLGQDPPVDPMAVRRQEKELAVVKGEHTVDAVADAFLAMRKAEWSKNHYEQTRRRLDNDVRPAIGGKSVMDVTPQDVSRIVKRIVARGAASQAKKLLPTLAEIFNFARTFDGVVIPLNPCEAASTVLPKRQVKAPRPALLTFDGLGDVLRRTDTANLSPSVRVALRLLAFTGAASRPGNVAAAEWREFDLDAAVPTWTVPRAKMKAKLRQGDHVIILGPTIAAELRSWRASTGGKGYVFPPPFGKGAHISIESIEKVFRVTLNLRDVHSPHGWRAAFKSLAREGGFDNDVIRVALDHVDTSQVESAYNRASYAEARRQLADWWDAQLVAAQFGTVAATPKPRVLRRIA